MGLSASGGQWHRTEAQPYRILRLVQSAASASGARVANTGRGLFRPARASRRTGRVTQWHGGAVNLWTVGCADPRLTAPARSPMDKPGKNALRFPRLAHRSAAVHKLHSATATTSYEFDFREKRNHQPATNLSLFSPEAVQTTGTVAVPGIATYPIGVRHGRQVSRRARLIYSQTGCLCDI